MTDAHVRVEEHDGVHALVLDRPAKLNALDRRSVAELEDAARRLASEASVVIVRSTTDRAFCVGADVTEHATFDAEDAYRSSRNGSRALQALAAIDAPVVAAISGHCLGGGLELALACDVRVATRSARLGFPEVTLGNTPAWGGVPRLVSLVGPGRAKDLLMSGRILSGAEAFDLGLVEHLADDDHLAARVGELAAAYAASSSGAVAAAKLAVDTAAGVRHAVLLDAFSAGHFQSTASARDAKHAFSDRSSKGVHR